jgi:biotin/methionine sulfoxide reductase
VILPHVVGNAFAMLAEATVWPVIAEHAELIVAFGGIPLKNAQVNAGGVTRHLTAQWLERCRDRGVQFVNVGPIRDDLAGSLGAIWMPIRPNTDTALMLALAHTLWSEGLAKREFLDRYCVGFERFLRYLEGADDGQPKHADWAEPICEMRAEQIRLLARRMARQRTFINVSWSLQRADHGEQTYWSAITLAAMLGGIGRPGEGFGLGYGAVARIGSPSRPIAAPTLPQGKNPMRRFIPVARIADMLLSPGERFDYNGQRLVYPDIRLIYWAGGNPFHHHQDLNRLLRAWRRPETIIVHEQFWNAHARHADIVLPATTALEREDIALSQQEQVLLAMRRIIEPVGEARDDHAIFAGIAEQMGVAEKFTEGRSADQWLRHLYEECRVANRACGVHLPPFDDFWQTGRVAIDDPEEPAVLLQSFRADPGAHRLATPSGRIEIYSERIASFGYEDCPAHPTWLEPYEWLGSPQAERHPLHLISNQPATRLHSQYDHGSHSRDHKIRDREPLLMHPKDAAARGIEAGEIVRVFNDRGACLAGAVLTDAIRPGVVQLATGAWYCPEVPGQPDSLELHGNPNVLTRDVGTSKLSQGPSAHTTLVEVVSYRGDPPAVTIFAPPELIAADTQLNADEMSAQPGTPRR